MDTDVVDTDASPVIVAEEFVPRGADWLARRWRDGGDKVKHMAIALRANTVTPVELAARWRSRAGQLGRPGSVTVIPEDVRGHPYVQNHPCPRTTGEWAYDAVNEVYCDDVAGLRRRIEWFRENLHDRAEEDLVRQSWFVAGWEEVVSQSRGDQPACDGDVRAREDHRQS